MDCIDANERFGIYAFCLLNHCKAGHLVNVEQTKGAHKLVVRVMNTAACNIQYRTFSIKLSV